MRPRWGVALLFTLALVGLMALAAAGCVKQYYPPNTKAGTPDVSPVAPTPLAVTHSIEFRALGTVPTVELTYGSAQEGTTVITTSVPWTAAFKTTRTNLFVFLTAKPQGFGRLSVQIFIDGELFREADADALPGDIIQASGTAELSAATLGLHH